MYPSQKSLYARYLVRGSVKTSFVRIVELPDGTAGSITESFSVICIEFNLDMANHLCGLGSGASVMLDFQGGVAMLLKDKVAFFVSNHCIVRRLALPSG